MATLDPKLLNTNALTQKEDSSKSKKTLSIFQSKRIIDDLENSIEQENLEENSSILHINRQLFSGMIVDVKTFDDSSKIKKQIISRNGEDNENIIFSLLVLKEENGLPREVIYKWTRKHPSEASRGSSVYITEEEHIYQGLMKNHRKHGNGEYIIIQKLSNSTENHIRYIGTWSHDIFTHGTMEDDTGVKKELKNTCITFRSKSNLKGKRDRNETIKVITAEMEKKKEKSTKFIQPIASSASIAANIKQKVSINSYKI